MLHKKPSPENKKTLPIEKAKELYPQWYQERIVEGKQKKKGTWICNVALYEWWKSKIMDNVKVGGRYFSIMALCAYGLKCGIPDAQIKKDAYSFLDHLESLTDDENNHFTREDVKDALKALKADHKLLSTMASREWIEKQTKVQIPPSHREKGKRLKQKEHLELARFSRDIRQRMNGTKWTDNNGRPDKAAIVKQWRLENPEGRKVDCIRDTGLDKKTVYKWWM